MVEDNPGDVRLTEEMLAEAEDTKFDIKCADRLSTGLECLAEEDIDVVLLDLGLPDSQGLDTFAEVYAQASEVPLVVLTSFENEEWAIKAAQKGAQDYLIKGKVDGPILVRTIRYAIERKRMQEELRNHSEHLEELEFEYCNEFSNIPTGCKNLRTIALSACMKIHNLTPLRDCPELRVCKLRGCYGIQSIAILNHNKKLEELELRFMNNVNELPEICKNLKTF